MIKEILEDMKKGIDTGTNRYDIKVDGMCLNWKDCKQLLGYINTLKEELKFIYDINHHNLGERIRLEGIILKANELLDHLGYGGSDNYYMKKINEIKDVLNGCDNNE